MLWSGHPPGADIGLHNSVIYSIVGSGPTDFLYNYYHIGGGISLTFPGYHIFTSSVMMITGMTATMEPIAHALVVSLFSALLVLAAFLLTRRVWSTSAALVVAMLVAISRFDIEMLMWAGYPNVITLLLIPVTFFLYLQKDRFSALPYYASTAILISSLFLTHSLSAGIFVAITAVAVFCIFFAPKALGTSRKTVFYWLLPIMFGAVLVLPFLFQAVPAYLSDNAYLNGSAGSDIIGSATLSARVLSLWIVVPLFGLIPAFMVLSKQLSKKWLTLPSFLLSVWVLVCLILTQGYLVKLPFDYNRFLYFLILPLLMFMGILIDCTAAFTARVTNAYRTLIGQTQTTARTMHSKLNRASSALTQKRIYSIVMLVLLVFSFIAIPLFMSPVFYAVGESIQSFYQTMDNQGWEALQWAKQSTAGNAVFVANAQYGWWFGGFAQKQTLSAVDPQYLSLNREVDNSTFARNLLDTDYMIDNGLIQVRDDGGYVARHNPEILVDQNWTYYPFSFFNFDNKDTSIRYHTDDGSLHQVHLNELTVIDMHMENDDQHATISVTLGNTDLNFTKLTTVVKDIRFVTVTSTVSAIRPNVSLEWIDISIQTAGTQIQYGDDINTVGFVDIGTKSFGQLIFPTTPTRVKILPGSPSMVALTYSIDGSPQSQISIQSGAYSALNDPQYYNEKTLMDNFFSKRMAENLNTALQPSDTPGKQHNLTVFDYKTEIETRNINYIICTHTETVVKPKFQNDPLFSLVFINEEVAIYKANGNLNQG